MCHDILKEDDEAASLHDNNAEPSDAGKADEQNGNIDAELAGLSLSDAVGAVNGNGDNEKTGITKASKKSKAKKGANVANSSGDKSAAASDNGKGASDNKASDSGQADELNVQKLAEAGDVIEDDATVVN